VKLCSIYPSAHRVTVRRYALAAAVFANSSGLPVTILSAVHVSHPGSASESIEPTTLLSIYSLVNPLLQWGMGCWLLGTEEGQTNEMVKRTFKRKLSSAALSGMAPREQDSAAQDVVVEPIFPLFERAVNKSLSMVLQPPAVGSLLGCLVASIHPLRSLFVALNNNNENVAPLRWLIDGLSTLGMDRG
jgi:predicted permease